MKITLTAASTSETTRLAPVSQFKSGLDLLDRFRTTLRCGRRRCECRRGKMLHCPAHDDQTPSFSVRLDPGRLLFHCFSGCSQKEVLYQLRLLGLWPSGSGAVKSAPLRSVHDEALTLALSQPWARVEVLSLYRAADAIRSLYSSANRLRSAATIAGNCEPSWNALADAARLESDAWLMETQLDGSLGS